MAAIPFELSHVDDRVEPHSAARPAAAARSLSSALLGFGRRGSAGRDRADVRRAGSIWRRFGPLLSLPAAPFPIVPTVCGRRA